MEKKKKQQLNIIKLLSIIGGDVLILNILFIIGAFLVHDDYLINLMISIFKYTVIIEFDLLSILGFLVSLKTEL